MGFLILAGGGWLASSAMTKTANVETADTISYHGEGPLDGMAFVGALGPAGQPKDVADTFVFSDGTFVSKECEIRCKYPARPYYARTTGNVIEFVSETKCPYKDAKIVWRGQLKDGRISGIATWTLKRWYWTIEQKFAFAGELANQSTPIASSQ